MTEEPPCAANDLERIVDRASVLIGLGGWDAAREYVREAVRGLPAAASCQTCGSASEDLRLIEYRPLGEASSWLAVVCAECRPMHQGISRIATL